MKSTITAGAAVCFLAIAASIASIATTSTAATAGVSTQSEDDTVYVAMRTNMGDFVLELDGEKAPISVENFVSYVKDGSYDGTIFHRVIPSFMIQGGGFDQDMNKKPTNAPIKNEWQNGLSNKRGTIAMARTNDPNSATNQFFINVVDNDRLDGTPVQPGYAVFGKVVKGMETVDDIRNVATTTKGQYQNVPVDVVIIEKAQVLSDEDIAKLELD